MKYLRLRIFLGVVAAIFIGLALGFQFGIDYVTVTGDVAMDDDALGYCRWRLFGEVVKPTSELRRNYSIWATINDYKVQVKYNYMNKEYTKDIILNTNYCQTMLNIVSPRKQIDVHIYKDDPSKIYDFGVRHYVRVAVLAFFGLVFFMGMFFPKIVVALLYFLDT